MVHVLHKHFASAIIANMDHMTDILEQGGTKNTHTFGLLFFRHGNCEIEHQIVGRQAFSAKEPNMRRMAFVYLIIHGIINAKYIF